MYDTYPVRYQGISFNVIKKNGGTIITSTHTHPDYLIVPNIIQFEKLNLP